MENLIIVILFFLASLVSYVNKIREKKRQEEGDLEGEIWQDTPPADPIGMPEIIRPVTIPEDKEKPEADQNLDHNQRTASPVFSQRIIPDREKVELMSAESLMIGSKDSALYHFPDAKFSSTSLNPLGKLEDISSQYNYSSSSHKTTKSVVGIKFKSLKQVRLGIALREILDRPRAYDT